MYLDLIKPHDLSQNFRSSIILSAHMQMKKMILYYMARALKEEKRSGACLESGRIVMTDDHSKGGIGDHSR
jgi:thymidine phosphorylase